MRVAVEHIRRMRGGSQPHLMRCDDGSFYVVKFKNNPQGVRVLANDMLATRLAARMGICVPDVDVVEVTAALIKNTYHLAIELPNGRIPCEPGRQFASKYPGHPSIIQTYDFISPEQIPNIANLDDFLGIFVFDIWTCNTDGRQAVLFRQPGPSADDTSRKFFLRVMMIDQGLCFNSGEWNFPEAPCRRVFVKHELYERVQGIEAFEPWLNWLENRLSLDILHEEAERVPVEWYEGGRESWMRLVECLYARRTRVRKLICSAQNAIPNPFPNWKLSAYPASFSKFTTRPGRVA
jgi:hypothetical protein